MKKLNKIQVGVAVLALATVFSPLAEYLVPTASAASFNQGSQPYKMIRGYNYSEKGSCACWQDGDIEAEVGDIVTFRVFYNDTSSETARETRVQVVPTSLSGQTATMTGRVWADNASTVTDTIRVRVPSGQEITDLDPIAVFWYDGFQNQMSLGGQSPSQVTSSSGLDVNDTLPGLENARFVVARFEIEGEEIDEEEEGDAPDVTTLSATDIDTDDARLQGEVDPNGDSTDAWFEWGTSSFDLDEETGSSSVGSGDTTRSFSFRIDDLEPGETYFFRAVARNDFGTDFGSIKSFTTDEEEEEEEGDAPDVITLSATDIDTDDACLRGEVDPNGDSTDAWFEWGTSSFDLDEETDDQSVGSGTSVRSFSFCLDDLRADETYFFRAVAENDLGDDLGSIRSFTTDEEGAEEEEVGPPDATTLSATGITSTSAALRGEVNPNNDQTDTWFEWGTTRSLSRKTGDQSIGSGDRDVSVSFVLTGLSPSTTYFYRVAAENDEGDDRGSILSFQTTAPVVIPPVTTVIERIVTVFRGEEEREEPEIIITLKSDKTGLADKDHEIVYTVSYENRTDRTFTDVSLEVRLPEDGIDLVDSNPESDDIRGDTLVFDIGTISPREEDEFEITIQVEDPEVGQDIILSASLSYVNPDNVRNVVRVEDIYEITEGDLTGVGLTARILDSLGDFFTNPIFWFLVFLALFFLAYRYLVYMRRRNLPMQQAPLTPPPAP